MSAPYVFRPPNSPFWHTELWVGGNRHRRTTKKRSKREAEAVARQIKERLLADHRASSAPASGYTLADGSARYVFEINAGQEIERQFGRNLSFLGADTRMADLTDDHIAKLVSSLRGRRKWGREDMPLLSAATVNRTGVELLRRVFHRAKEFWGARFEYEPKWGRHRLKEPPERTRELRSTERVAINDAARDDYVKVYTFARLTGFRQTECLLRKSEVHWDAKKIRKIGKGGKEITADLTPAVEALLLSCWDDHPDDVFTFVAQKTRDGRVRGRRYPITVHGLKSDWKRTRDRAGVQDFRFHDFRHDFGTKAQRASRNPKVTKRAMNHANIASTFRYIAVIDEEVKAAVEAAQEAQSAPTSAPTPTRKAG